ncbi:MAG TPA: DUF5668 domain-containing protein [Leptolinea sp.]
MNDNNSNNWQRGGRRGIFFPLLLLCAGVLLLLSNFGYLPGGFWGFISMYWPALIILAGLDGLIRGNGITGSILMAGFGGVLLAGNLGYISITAWDLVSKAWPLILIGIGLDIIIGHRTVGRALLGLALAFLLILGLLWIADVSLPSAVKVLDFSEKYQNESSLILNIQRTAGDVEIASGVSDGMLVQGKLNLLRNEEVEPVVQHNADSTEIDLSNSKSVFPGTSRPLQNSSWKFAIHEKPALTLHSKVIMGENRLDLRGLNVKEMSCETSTGRSVVYLSETLGSTNLIIGATGQITLYVPAGEPVKIITNRAIGALSIPDRYSREDGYIKSPAFQAGKPAIEVTVNLPIGAIQVVEYSTSL